LHAGRGDHRPLHRHGNPVRDYGSPTLLDHSGRHRNAEIEDEWPPLFPNAGWEVDDEAQAQPELQKI
jgi:hypothetical protein